MNGEPVPDFITMIINIGRSSKKTRKRCVPNKEGKACSWKLVFVCLGSSARVTKDVNSISRPREP